MTRMLIKGKLSEDEEVLKNLIEKRPLDYCDKAGSREERRFFFPETENYQDKVKIKGNKVELRATKFKDFDKEIIKILDNVEISVNSRTIQREGDLRKAESKLVEEKYVNKLHNAMGSPEKVRIRRKGGNERLNLNMEGRVDFEELLEIEKIVEEIKEKAKCTALAEELNK